MSGINTTHSAPGRAGHSEWTVGVCPPVSASAWAQTHTQTFCWHIIHRGRWRDLYIYIYIYINRIYAFRACDYLMNDITKCVCSNELHCSLELATALDDTLCDHLLPIRRKVQKCVFPDRSFSNYIFAHLTSIDDKSRCWLSAITLLTESSSFKSTLLTITRCLCIRKCSKCSSTNRRNQAKSIQACFFEAKRQPRYQSHTGERRDCLRNDRHTYMIAAQPNSVYHVVDNRVPWRGRERDRDY